MSDPIKILVSDKLSDAGLAILKSAGFEVDVKIGLKPAELAAVIAPYDGLVIRSGSKVTREVIEAADNLKVVGRAGIGVDNVDVPAASERGVVVMNTPGGNAVTTAEHAIAMMMALSRKIPQASASMKSGKWEKTFMGVELCGKTLGIIGLGRIGALVAKRARGLEMKVIGFDPYISPEAAEKLGVETVGLEELYSRADFITIHTILNDETRGLLNSKAFAKMKKGVRIINCARGSIVDEKDLAEAIRQGIVAGAALDVFEKEPPDDMDFIKMDELVATPHLGASTKEAQESVALGIAHQVVDFFSRGVIINAVNVPSLSPEQIPVVRPYLELGEKLGLFIAQAAGGAPTKLEITYMGDAAALPTQAITQAVVKGLLEAHVGKTVNFVNASHLARSRGVTVSSTSSAAEGSYTSVVGVKLTTGNRETRIEGAVFPGGRAMLLKLDDFYLEAHLSGDMILFTNNDKPGVIGAVATALGKNGVNIASFELTRVEQGGLAMAVVTVDSAPEPAVISQLSKIENVREVRLVRL
ncbi:MAG: phosphoglycerate dehydrogenase [Nitrospinae bacterium]|nr:phosphoglycerate dehydrogenase [Nitrospinota bacterium]